MIRRKCWTAAICLGFMTLLGGDRLSAAGPVKKQSDDAMAKMVAEGWKEISKGVFERQLGPDRVEHLGFGQEGLEWTIGDMSRRLELLRQEQESYPSEKLAKIINDLTTRLASTRRELWNLELNASEGMSSVTANVAGGSCSSICYSATANAYGLTSTQGVTANAEAKFNSSCGYSGNTYAFAYARATQGTVTTTKSQEDPRAGANVTSGASASANGGLDCFSEAFSSVSSSALGISYSTSANNYSCPVQPCSVTISGTTYEYFYNYGCVSRTWTANVSGCSPSTYQWWENGTPVGTGSTYTRNVCAYGASFNLEVTVNGTAYDSHYVAVDTYYCECGPCNGQICN
jgi:hypothetical protein